MGTVEQMWAYVVGWAREVKGWLTSAWARVVYVVLAYVLVFASALALVAGSTPLWVLAGFYLMLFLAASKLVGWLGDLGFEIRNGKSFDQYRREQWMSLGRSEQRLRDLQDRMERIRFEN